ncbi:MAG: FAD-binding oxidoreductase [Burkholderiales bacterium]|nr:FAD-binding oxidoreductase [Burkholderiales bacterium]
MTLSFQSWGRYPALPQRVRYCHWRDELARVLGAALGEGDTTLPVGNGRSYGDSCLAASGQVLRMRPLDRIIAVDWATGRIEAEAGVTLEEVLALSIPRGWFLPVTPGTRYVTLGGAVANDVHGKNHHVRGTFGRHVRRIGLVRSERAPLVCGPETERDWFAVTVGGLGLSGVIDWVELQLLPIRSSLVDSIEMRFDNLDEFFDLSALHDASYEYSVAWIDCLARGNETGRGVYMAGNHAAEGALAVDMRRQFALPFAPRGSLVNAVSLRMFNGVYYRAHSPMARKRVGYGPFFYPLDAILHWNRMYGAKGFQQYQCVVPEDAAREGIRALLEAVAASGMGSFLAVLKRCGDLASPGLLSFPMPGVSLALDFPQHDDIDAKLFSRLDAITRAASGRLYPAKDAHMTGADFRRAYPAWEQVEAKRDPALTSRFWQRVTRS